MTSPGRAPARFLHPSNLVTYTGLALGFVAVLAAAIRRDAALAGIALAAAVIADTFDGRFARRFARSPEQAAFGGQLDSLADAIVSGMAPALVIVSLAWNGAVSARWAALCVAAIVYVCAAVTRLGAFNLSDDGDAFVGLPTPVSTLIVSTALLWQPGAVVGSVLLVGCAVAMVSAVPIPRPRGRALALFAAWPVVLIALHAVAVG
jgi:CDP-diacylglycerol--serine O-phosphatidyltransferase